MVERMQRKRCNEKQFSTLMCFTLTYSSSLVTSQFIHRLGKIVSLFLQTPQLLIMRDVFSLHSLKCPIVQIKFQIIRPFQKSSISGLKSIVQSRHFYLCHSINISDWIYRSRTPIIHTHFRLCFFLSDFTPVTVVRIKFCYRCLFFCRYFLRFYQRTWHACSVRMYSKSHSKSG